MEREYTSLASRGAKLKRYHVYHIIIHVGLIIDVFIKSRQSQRVKLSDHVWGQCNVSM